MGTRIPRKRPIVEVLNQNEEDLEKTFRFQILLPNGVSVRLVLPDPGDSMLLDEFVHSIKREVDNMTESSTGGSRRIKWNGDIYLEDLSNNVIRKKIHFRNFKPNKCHILRLHDEVGTSVDTFQNMWDLTPDTDLLAELPAEYTFDTALADLIDNSLQAVWSNAVGERRLIRGKMGSSKHRLSKKDAVGGEPPYLLPFFGMFGYGGPIASMHLGRYAVVSSKTKESMKVYTLRLERDLLLKKRSSCIWRTDGGIRPPTDEEIKLSPHGSFTQVVVHGLKLRRMETYKLQCMLKDIYFPYIQYDDESNLRKTMIPIEFQVNDHNLAEVEGGETAITNMNSSNGPDFVFKLKFVAKEESLKSCSTANARLKCVYFPVAQGNESINTILEIIKKENPVIKESFETFSRVSIRRLGRLLPDDRWNLLPFMQSKRRKDKAPVPQKCYMRVKCFVETDAGFSPTPSKTALAHHDPFTAAIRNFGSKQVGSESVLVEIIKDQKLLSLAQLDKEYEDWIVQMHENYDIEIDGGVDEPVVIFSPQNKKELRLSADAIRVHKVVKRKGNLWKSGQRVKAVTGKNKKALYATIEHILIEGFEGDAGGGASLVCRPLGLSNVQSSEVVFNNENAEFNIQHESCVFPLSLIDDGKLQAVDDATWNKQLQILEDRTPASIDILSSKECHGLGIDGELPVEAPVRAGHKVPCSIVAVLRPTSFVSSRVESLSQKYIIKVDVAILMEVKHMPECKEVEECAPILSERVEPSSLNGIQGLYIFNFPESCLKLFQKAGVYTFSFSVLPAKGDSMSLKNEKRVIVKPIEVDHWRILSEDEGPLTVRVGSCIRSLSLACYDIFSNQIPVLNVPEAAVKITANGQAIALVEQLKMFLSADHLTLNILDIQIESSHLDMILPSYSALLEVSIHNNFSASLPCEVTPGCASSVTLSSYDLEKPLTPDHVIEQLIFEITDDYGNHVQGVEAVIDVDGLDFQDNLGQIRLVDDGGFVILNGILKVVAPYGSKASLIFSVDGRQFIKREFRIAERELRVLSTVPKLCYAGSLLENVIFGVYDSHGEVDRSISGQNHTLVIKTETGGLDMVQYTFNNGQCCVPFLNVPKAEGNFRFSAVHSRHPNLSANFEIQIMPVSVVELDMESDPASYGLQLPCSQYSSSHVDFLVESIVNDTGELDAKVEKAGIRVRYLESKLKELEDQKADIQNNISTLSASLKPHHQGLTGSLIDKQEITRRIEKTGNAAAVCCLLSKAIQHQDVRSQFMQGVVGIVALLGAVEDARTSRILAAYLGEDYMNALVCMSYNEATSKFEMYDPNGDANRDCALRNIAASLGLTLNGRFTVICLDRLRPYSIDRPSGKTPTGFLGYAVDMIHLDPNLRTMTGRRLFYALFGDLQVYRTREDMRRAPSFIKNGAAVSLDGGIIKDSGVLYIGDSEPKVMFPVLPPADLPRDAVRKMIEIRENEARMETIDVEIRKVSESLEHQKAKFSRKCQRLRSKLDKVNLLDVKPLAERR